MNNWMSDGVHVSGRSRSTAARCSTRREAQGARRVGPLQGRRRRRHPVPHDSGRRHAGVLHARLRPQREGRSTASGPTTTSRTWTGWRASSRPRASYVPKPVVDERDRREDRHHRATARRTGRSTESRDQLREETERQDVVLPAARVSVHRRARGVHRRARAHLRRRAEPRRADAAADEARADAGAADASCAACCTTTACRSTPAASPTMCWRRKGFEVREEDGRAPRRQRRRGMDGWRIVNGDASQEVNRIGLEPQLYKRRQDDAVRRLRPQRDLRAHHRRVLRDGHRSEAGRQAVGHRLLEQEPGVLPRRLARLQRRPRPHAVGRHRRDARQPEADRHRHQRRRRHRRDRHRPVRPPDAPQPADHLHHRGQRLLRPDQGAVLADRRPRLEAEERRRQRPAADRHLRAGDRARRDVRRRARSRATRSSCCRSSRRRSRTAAP